MQCISTHEIIVEAKTDAKRQYVLALYFIQKNIPGSNTLTMLNIIKLEYFFLLVL